MKKLIVATHSGSGHSIVEEITDALDGHLVTVHTVEHAQDLEFDRLILLGGSDVDPFWYGEDEKGAHGVDLDRDCIEWTLARRAITYGIPTLGICRGHQMLAVASGGTLHQDIGWKHVSVAHQITIASREVARHFPTDLVNSMHHQSVKNMPIGFTQAAFATKDRCCESIWRPGYLGVQFHPEYLIIKDNSWIELFQWFMEGLGMTDPPAPTRTVCDVDNANVVRLKKPFRKNEFPMATRKKHQGWYYGSRHRAPFDWEKWDAERGGARWPEKTSKTGALDTVKYDTTREKELNDTWMEENGFEQVAEGHWRAIPGWKKEGVLDRTASGT